MTRRVKLALVALVAMALATWTVLAGAQGHGSDEHAAPAATGHAAPAATGGHAGPSAGGDLHGETPAAVSHGAGGHHGPEPINWTDIWDKRQPAVLALVINFGLLMALYYMLGKKPIAEALKQRRVTIGKEIDDAQKLLNEAKERAKKYQGDLKNVDADAATAKAALITAAKGEVEHLVSEAEERSARMKRDAERLVEQEEKQVRIDLIRETVEGASGEAAQLLAKAVTSDDHLRLAQDLLAELAKRPSATRDASSTRPGGAS